MGIRKLKERTLAKDLVITLTLAVVVVMSICMGLFYVWSSVMVSRELNKQADFIASEFVGVLGLPVYQYDTEFIEKIIRVYQQKDLVTNIRVILLPSATRVETDDFEMQGDSVRSQNIFYDGILVGAVDIVFSSQSLQHDRLSVFKMMLSVTLIVLLIIIVGTFQFVKNSVQLPLEKLLLGITTIADGEYQEQQALVPQKDLAEILDQVQHMGRQIHRKNRVILEADARYRSIFDGAADGLFIATVEGRFLTVNPSMVRILGFNSSEVMLSTIKNISTDIFVDPDEFYNIVTLTKSHGPITGLELQVYHRDGHKIWILINARLSRDDSLGSVLEGSIEDVTEIRKLEANLRHSQKMEAVGTMAGGIAHDFNNILTAIMGYTELAKIREISPEIAGDLDEIYKATLRAKDLTSQILTFSRRDEAVVEPVLLAPIVEEALGLIQSSLPSTIQVEKEIHCEQLVRIDSTKMHQIVMNLCTNAHHAMLESGGQLGVSLSEVEAGGDVALLGVDLAEGTYALLEISDTGCGMDDVEKEKIFEPYYSTKKAGQGTGLGLAVVHSIVEGAGGRVSVYSLLGMGTSFHIYLPVI